ncbi:MAG: hypothetical protein HC881_16665 [Leptolyngbyaceae cyanobacterium SL_7_1]|nr:hypothetical protein [Leptolyngbyaceae cyanobacterium SL_7_1]
MSCFTGGMTNPSKYERAIKRSTALSVFIWAVFIWVQQWVLFTGASQRKLDGW